MMRLAVLGTLFWSLAHDALARVPDIEDLLALETIGEARISPDGGWWHNLVWFNHYLWGDPLPELDAPPLPEPTVDSGDETADNR